MERQPRLVVQGQVMPDAGAQWMIKEQGRTLERMKASGNVLQTNIAPARQDATSEGLRIPQIWIFFLCDFVLPRSQVKSKDLKIAIENSRRERRRAPRSKPNMGSRWGGRTARLEERMAMTIESR